jgi:hypothetical protein
MWVGGDLDGLWQTAYVSQRRVPRNCHYDLHGYLMFLGRNFLL